MSKYILVTGGELFNKGAQAMTYITVDYIAKKYPEYKVVLFSGADCSRTNEEKNNFKFEILPFPGLGESVAICTGLLKKRYTSRSNGEYFKRYKNIFDNAAAMIDISGYALGSNWPKTRVDAFLRRMYLAKRFKVPVYLMPQSFGPFDYKGLKGALTNFKIKRCLSYVKCIMAREEDGVKLLREKYKLKNVVKTCDLVLQNTGIDLSNVFYNIPQADVGFIKSDSVAVIPNSKNEKNGNRDAIMSIYKSIIDKLIENKKTVYLIYHAVEDLKICKEIKNTYFPDIEDVVVIEKELSSIEFGQAVSKFDFVVASRYHSVVHAYKEAVPAIVLGWAIKYLELTDCFDQKGFCFDVRNELDVKAVLSSVEYMLENHKIESDKISDKLECIQNSNVYDSIELK